MCGFSRKIAYGLTFLTLIAALFFIIAVATPNWIKVEAGGGKTYAGLNKICSEAGGSKSCQTYDYGKCDTNPYNGDGTTGEPCDKFKTVQSLSLLAVLVSGLALFALLAMLAMSSIGSIPQVLAFLMILGAGVCGMIAMSTYADLAKDTLKNANDAPGVKAGYDFSFGLLIIAWIFSYLVFVLGFFTGAASGTAKISGST